MIKGVWTPFWTICFTAKIFPLSLPQKTSFCEIDSLAEFRSPTVRRTQWCMTLRANRSAVSGSVAENKALRHFFFFAGLFFFFFFFLSSSSSSSSLSSGLSHACTMASICSTKPISKSLSASSKTKNSTACVEIFFCIRSDASRNGVETRISTFLKSFAAVALESCVTLFQIKERKQLMSSIYSHAREASGKK